MLSSLKKRTPHLRDLSDEALMTELVQGNQSAFDELYHRYSKRMLYYFFRMLGQDEEKAQDFLQDLFMKVVEKPGLFDPSRKFSTWLFSVAHNMCKNEYRKLQVRQVMDNHTPVEDLGVRSNGHGQDHETDLRTFNEQLFRELDQLDDNKRTAFLLRHREGFSVKEISEVLECSEGTVKSRVFYANKYLAERLSSFKGLANGL